MNDDLDLAANPYAPASALQSSGMDWSAAERIRHEHAKTEGDIRAAGHLFYIGTIVAGVLAIQVLVEAGSASQQPPVDTAGSLGIAASCAATSGLLWWCGRGLRRLDPRVRWPVILLVSPGLLALPVGTFVAARIMLLVGSEQGKFIFSPQYKAIRDATPHVRAVSSVFQLFVIALAVTIVMLVVLVFSLGN